ncbi:MAG TPA: glycosyltransferase family 2 protein [Dehalococcoidia bacterium]|nr:glycosyltransferase family 2 protein [Dehalococcoidia bacterium]
MGSRNASDIELSLIVPTYNEKDNIAHLAERVDKALSQYSYELIVVDDNSPDGTAEVAKSLSAQYPIRVIVRTNERGLASAVVAGFREARGKVLGAIDADLQHPPEVLPSLLETIKGGTDVAIASRYIEGGGTEGWSINRRIISKVAAKLTILPAGLLLPSIKGIKDPLTGFFLFKRHVIEDAVLAPTGYKILLEVLVKGNAGRVIEVPYIFRARERGKSNLTLREQIKFLIHLIRLAWFEGNLKRFVKFCIVGASGTVINWGVLTLCTELGGLHYRWSAVIAYEISILNNFTWNELWTFRDRRIPGRKTFFKRVLKYHTVAGAGVGIHVGMLSLFTDVVGFQYNKLSWVIATACVVLWDFSWSVIWTWRVKHKAKSTEVQILKESA